MSHRSFRPWSGLPRGRWCLAPRSCASPWASRTGPRELERLTPREREVLGLNIPGRTNAGICAELFLSAGTVEKNSTTNAPDSPPAAKDPGQRA